jgi:hypothetical protein
VMVAAEAEGGDEPDEPQDRPFDPHRNALGDNLKAIVADVLNQLQNYEKYYKLRKRRRKANDQSRFERTIEAIVCDLTHRALTEPDGWIAVSLSNQVLGVKNRYGATALNTTLPTVLKNLASPEMSFVDLRLGHLNPFGENRQSTIRAGERLLTRIEEHRIDLGDIGRLAGEEVIILKDRKARNDNPGDWIDYEDTATTRNYRQQMQTINQWLAEAEVYFENELAKTDRRIDDRDRFLRRHFNNGSFEEGGRLFGGFWLNMSKHDRREALTIDGEFPATLDFGQMALRIVYGMVGATPPEGDAYRLPGLEGHRDGVKKVLNAMLYKDKPAKRLPRGTRQLFPDRVSFQQVRDLVEERHPKISHMFYRGIGIKTMHVESDILVDVLLHLRDRGIVGLPIHDAVMVPRSKSSAAKDVMLEVFKRHTGVDGIVEEETSGS